MRIEMWLSAIGLGILVAMALLVATFFPFGTASALLLVLSAAMLLAYWRPASWLMASLVLAVPPVALMGWIVLGLDPGGVARGIGTGLVIQLVTIPFAAVAGGYLGQRLGLRERSRQTQ